MRYTGVFTGGSGIAEGGRPSRILKNSTYAIRFHSRTAKRRPAILKALTSAVSVLRLPERLLSRWLCSLAGCIMQREPQLLHICQKKNQDGPWTFREKYLRTVRRVKLPNFAKKKWRIVNCLMGEIKLLNMAMIEKQVYAIHKEMVNRNWRHGFHMVDGCIQSEFATCGNLQTNCIILD